MKWLVMAALGAAAIGETVPAGAVDQHSSQMTGWEEGSLYLSGSDGDMRPLWRRFQILSSLESGEDTLHSAPVRIYNRKSVWVSTLHVAVDLSRASLLHDIRTALRAGDS